jgi:uncharacterized membrane protein
VEITGSQETVQLGGTYQLMGYADVVVVVVVVFVVVIVVVVIIIITIIIIVIMWGENIKRNTKMPLNSAKVLVCK